MKAQNPQDKLTDVAMSLDATAELMPYLPSLLADLDALGMPPDGTVQLLLSQQFHTKPTQTMLDLGCGKGATLIRLAHVFGWQGFGMDWFPEFIAAAQIQARKFHVERLLEFATGDMAEFQSESAQFDLIIFGEDSHALGDLSTALRKMTSWLRPQGAILLDTVWRKHPQTNPELGRSYSELSAIAQRIGLSLLATQAFSPSWVHRHNAKNTHCIQKRATDLTITFPKLSSCFKAYVKEQEAASRQLSEDLVCALVLLKALP